MMDLAKLIHLAKTKGEFHLNRIVEDTTISKLLIKMQFPVRVLTKKMLEIWCTKLDCRMRFKVLIANVIILLNFQY